MAGVVSARPIVMTERLYYHDSFLHDFEAQVLEVGPAGNSRHAVVLDRTAFYPSSGGQVHDTGWIFPISDHASPAEEGSELRVREVAETEDGRIVHYIEAEKAPAKGTQVHGVVDPARRRDHMQQHSGQHVLSAAFVRMFNMPTVSFHMGEEYCSIDLDAAILTQEQMIEAENLSNEIIWEDRSVDIRFATLEEARELGLRKVPPLDKDKLRLIDIHDFDLTACGGTHVRSTGQIGSILLRKLEKVKQGWRVEFVCGERAIAVARRDYSVLTEAAGLFSTHIRELPQQIRKSLDEARALRKSREHLLEEVAELQATQMLAQTAETAGRKIVVRVFPDRDVLFLKLLAQKVTRLDSSVIALLGATSGQASLVFAQSPNQPFDMASLMKEVLSKLGGRGGGSKDLAQGGVPQGQGLELALGELKAKLSA
jgi:alanyl-tRNA synthetase